MIPAYQPPLAPTDSRRDTVAMAVRMFIGMGCRRGSRVFIAQQLGVSEPRISKILRDAGFRGNIRRRP